MPLFTSAVLSIFIAGCQVCTVRLCSSLRHYISPRVRGPVTSAWNLGRPLSGEPARKLSARSRGHEHNTIKEGGRTGQPGGLVDVDSLLPYEFSSPCIKRIKPAGLVTEE